MKPTRPISQRDTTVGSPGEVGRRLVFLVFVLTWPVGLITLAAGLSRHRDPWTTAGALTLVLGAILYFLRKRWGAPAVAEELRTTTFKPTRRPKDEIE